MNKNLYDIVVVGAGAAGCMAAIKAAELKKEVLLLERNSFLGKKILLTGNGRCNLTNATTVDTCIKKFAHSGKFLRTAFSRLTSEGLLNFFRRKGLEFKTEDAGKVFPVTDKARSITEILEQCLAEHNVHLVFNAQAIDVKNEKKSFLLTLQDNASIEATRLILATGGASYKKTGSDGNGAILAKNFGHALVPFTPALIPLTTAEPWVKDLQGLSFQAVRITVHQKDKKSISELGDILFTHFGISGPLIIDLSAAIIAELKQNKEIKITTDLKPEMNTQQLNEKLTQASMTQGNIQINNLINTLLPKRMTQLFLSLIDIKHEKMLNQITKKERLAITENLKAFPLTITGSLPIDQAMATNGGININDIHQKTMESKLIPGLYFAGEIIDGRGPSGGYNLQQAFSTGFLAGESAAKSLTNAS